MSPEAIAAAVVAELRAGGKPTTTYLKLAAEKHISRKDAIRLTNEILISFEERLCALEEAG